MSSPSEPSSRPADWEAFYRDYRKPGYVPGFEITSKLGGGMFGLVFRARRMSIGKDYAIKFLQVDDGEVRKAVLSELEQVQWFAQIDHPNLVSIEDRGEVDGIPYLVMAFAGTETLRDKLDGTVPAGEAKDELLRWLLQSARGLAALHERSLVHFDVKPANVFLKGAVARLGDYGLSKLITHSRGSLSMGRGTPYYMAPEMLQRRGDHRSDVYSLGVMLYEVLTGKVPFTGDSEWEVLKKHETAAPVMPGHLEAREVAILQRCLHKDPAARFQSVHDVIAAFGVPAGAGAAAWTELGGKGAGPRSNADGAAPLPGGSTSKAPEDDPFVGLGRAAREAARHAGKIANQAAQEAGRVAQAAAAKARRMMREHLGPEHRRQLGGLFGRRRRGPAAAEPSEPLRAAAPAPGPATEPITEPIRHRRGWRRIPGALIAACCVALPLFFFVRGAPMPGVAAGIAVPNDRTQTFRTFTVPRGLGDLVSMSEPEWVEQAQHDREASRETLLAHIDRLRARAPLRSAERSLQTLVPSFEAADPDPQRTLFLEQRFAAFLQQTGYDDEEASRLAQHAPRALVIAATQLDRTDWGNAVQFEQAVRLQHWLAETTGCKDLELVGDGELPRAQQLAANRTLGKLWLWFVNEFAHTERTWRTFQALIPKR